MRSWLDQDSFETKKTGLNRLEHSDKFSDAGKVYNLGYWQIAWLRC